MAESMNLRRPEPRPTSGSFPKKVGLGLVVLLIMAGLLLSGLDSSWGSSKAASSRLEATPTPAVTPGEALKELRATEDALLTTYGWVDRKNGIVHIPIDRAIDLLAQRGLPTRP